ncbi:MAG: NAD+ synthase, partial [Planctomycetota bacterium]
NEDAAKGGRALFNAVALIEDGIFRIVARKSLLPTYDIFDEARYFEPWPRPEENLLSIGGLKLGISICEDAWNDAEFFTERLYPIDPIERLAEAGADLLVNISASPWRSGNEAFRMRMLKAASKRHSLPLILVNQVGGNVNILFDGGSMALGPDGLASEPVYFAESMQVVDTTEEWREPAPAQDICAMQHAALCMGIADFIRKFGFGRVLIGLSGGIDSALTAALAVDALGPDAVIGIAMPSSHSSAHSLEDARVLAASLGIEFHVIPISGLQAAFDEALEELFEKTEPGVAEENLQARMRGNLLMAYANKFDALLLTTGNKSEAAVGYCTLYGDMCGALAPIADLWKTEVYALARWMNRDAVRIPENSINKPPSAELRPGQLDSDSLPDYEELDPVLRLLIEERLPTREVAEKCGMDLERVEELFRWVQNNEFKRFQYAPTLRVSSRCWGGRRLPVVHRFLRE